MAIYLTPADSKLPSLPYSDSECKNIHTHSQMVSNKNWVFFATLLWHPQSVSPTLCVCSNFLQCLNFATQFCPSKHAIGNYL